MDTTLTSSSYFFFYHVWTEELEGMFPLSSRRKYICKENKPHKEIPLAWYFFFFFLKQNLLERGGSL